MGHEAKQRIYEQFGRIGKMLASPSRLELLDLLAQGERSVEALAREAALSVANASQHLQALYAARLVESRREGQRIVYRLADPSVERLLSALKATAERQLAELDTVAREYLDGRDQFEPIDRKQLLERLRSGAVTLIDVRPREEYEQAHLPGAVSVPLEELKTWAKTASRKKQVVAYCRGPYCVYAIQAVAELHKRGIPAARCEDGVVEWRAHGHRLESGRAS
jgi:rhodanese-related sulfurtransferase/DNA-binding transcriptional ArsR family regulator